MLLLIITKLKGKERIDVFHRKYIIQGRIMIEDFNDLTANELIFLLPIDQIKHSLNVAMLVGKLVNWLPEYKTSDKDNLLQHYGEAAYYHDIGKVCVSPNILNKSEALTTEEYKIIRRHTLYAKELLGVNNKTVIEGISSMVLPLVIDAAIYHHEWWNGKGYPYGLSGLDIPYVARVTSVCDAYDAMVSNRSYRQSYTHESACEELNRGAGSQFEPTLIKVFLEHEEEVLHILTNSMCNRHATLR